MKIRVLWVQSILLLCLFLLFYVGISSDGVSVGSQGFIYVDSYDGVLDVAPRLSVVGRGPSDVFLNEVASEELLLQRRLFLEDSRMPDVVTVERVFVGGALEGDVKKKAVKKKVSPYGPSGFTESEINTLLAGSPLEGLGSVFLDVESEHGVSAAFLVAVAKQESNLGRSRLGRVKKNLFGYAAYDRDPYGSAHAYSSYESCIWIVSERIATNYLSVGGKYYRGGTIKAIGSLWASDPGWAGSVEAIYRGYIVE